MNALDAGEVIPYYLCTRREDKNSARGALIREIELKLQEYDVAFDAYHGQLERPRPTDRDIKSVINWFDGNKPLIPAESKIFTDWDDLAAAHRSEEYGIAERLVERIYEFMKSRFRRTVTPTRSTDDRVIITSLGSIAAVSRFCLTILAAMSLLVPIIVLEIVQSPTARLWIVCGFSLVFSMTLSLLTRAGKNEIFASTAAYDHFIRRISRLTGVAASVPY